MKKLIGPFAAVLGGIFTVGVFVIIISLSYAALGRIFPASLFDQASGMLLFDAAAVVWFLIFIGNCKSTGQYIFSGLGFLLGVLGSIGLIGIEVGISSGMLTAADMTKPLTYIFIGAAVGHLLLTYSFHAAAPEISAQISMGVEQAKAQEEGMRQAEETIARDMERLGHVISARILENVYRNLNMPQTIINTRALPMDDSLHVPSNAYPVPHPTQETHAPARSAAPSFFRDPGKWLQNKFGRGDTETRTYEQTVQESLLELQLSANDRQGWVNTKIGTRTRMWCLDCRDEGDALGFTSPAPCEHVLMAQPVRTLPFSERERMLDQFIAEANAMPNQEDAEQPKAPFQPE